MNTPDSAFSDAAAVAGYAERTTRLVPGLYDLQRMAALLLAERAPAQARVMVLGAGGGLELKVFAQAQPQWRFDGIDPSAEMLRLARAALGPLAARVAWHEGYADTAPDGPFDAAACLLTLHFLAEDERRRTVAEVHRRLAPGAPFVVAHHSFPNQGPAMDRWLARNAAFAIANGVAPAQALGGIEAFKQRLPVLPPAVDEAILREAGFADVELFYAGLTFKGWVGYKA
ncbi:class I SAM-dependent methyltransferase [Lysobacter enzymogenes]|uniref:class I SAM-dependent methyltransferase n=1 Tax=Lysobacter enzymogenes TaxID=69 RepID=UPI00099C5E2A|nr:class I SAM-dependent methyltransferase [Lysobacter enzymogenes]UZW60172.1 class I SAM-dependent methyltransferase [Lysobacter enzymogenes]